MLSQRHLPATILFLTILSATAILVGGWHFAKVETLSPIERDQAPFTDFTSAFLEEIRDLESLYQSHLNDIKTQFYFEGSHISITHACRNIIGVEQVTVFGPGWSRHTTDLREGDRSPPLPEPYLTGSRDDQKKDGIILDPHAIDTEGPWITQPGHPLHYVARLRNYRTLVLRINTDQTAAAMDQWLSGWLEKNYEPLKISGINAEVVSPLGNRLIYRDEITGEKPSLILPIQSILGRWQISKREEYQTITTYRPQVLIASVSLALFLAIIGLFGFIQQNRALNLAEQRVSFVNRVSHELRTPMTNILLNLDLLSDSIIDKSPRTRKSLSLIRDETERLSRLLANVLTFSQSEQDKKTAKSIPVAIPELVNEVVDQFTPLLKRKGIDPIITPQKDRNLYAHGNPDAIRQIIGNLISNVEKYSATNQPFEIEIYPQDQNQNDYVVIAITDNGPGIKASKKAQIFKPFVRLNDSTTEGVSGTGLGLAISRDLATSMEGTLTVQSPLPGKNHGSRFELVLPRSGSNIISIAS